MKAMAVVPGKPNSIDLTDLPEPSVDDILNGRGALVEVLCASVDGTERSTMPSTARPLGADLQLDNALDLSREVAVLCYTLDPDALERYRQVGADTAAAVAEVASSLE